jgi:succinate dehydrogenase/fumarate reductase-like Fe-S protein
MKITVIRGKTEQEAGRPVVYDVPDQHLASVSNVLQYINRHIDGTLGYYLSCRRGLCVCCVMKINGKNETACVVPATDGMVIEPIRGDLVIQDTVVNLSMVRDSAASIDQLPDGA